MKAKRWGWLVGAAFAFGTAASLSAQAPAGGGDRAAVEERFKNDLIKAETTKIQALGALAATQPKDEAAKTYDDLFRFAIGAGLYEAAEPFAKKVVAETGSSHETVLLALLVKIVAEAKRGAHDESLKSLTAALAAQGDDKNAIRAALPLPARLSLVNTYVGRLVHDKRYDVAKKALAIVAAQARDPEMKNLVAARMRQVELVGAPAPEIVGTDVEGKPVKLSDHKGSVVLVLFWATWCAPNGREADDFAKLAASYRSKGFKVIGVNLDAHEGGDAEVAAALPLVRRFLIDHNVVWPTLMNGAGAADHAKTYGVHQLPSDVLIGRDGKVIDLDVDVEGLRKKLAALLGS